MKIEGNLNARKKLTSIREENQVDSVVRTTRYYKWYHLQRRGVCVFVGNTLAKLVGPLELE